MKRTALLLVMAVYLISCMGMSINRFYCCGKLASVSYTLGATDNTTKSAKNANCCGHQNQSFKVKDSHFSASSFSLNHPLPVIIPSLTKVVYEPVAVTLTAKIVYKANAPPGLSAIPVYILNCAYRI